MARHLRLHVDDLKPLAQSALIAGIAAAALSLLPGCGDDDRAPLAGVSASGTGGRAGGTSHGAGGGTGDASSDPDADAPDGSTGHDGGGGRGAGGSPDGSAGVMGSGGGPVLDGGSASGARCSTHVDDDPWANLGRIDPMDGGSFGRFGAVSSDELTVVWTSPAGDVFFADRPMSPGTFGTAEKLNKTPLAVDRAAMSPTGLLVLAVAKDRGSMIEYRRASRSEAFSPADATDLAGLGVLFEGGGTVSEPVLGSDKASFFFLVTMSGGPPALLESKWSDANSAWGPPHDFPNAELLSKDAAHRRRPTGVSSDGRTLFFYDEVAGIERGAWRATPDSPFDAFFDIGDFPDAAPNLRCDTLYFTGSDADGPGLFLGG